MNLTPDEQAALDSLGAPRTTRTIRTEIDGFERDPDTGQIFLLLPVPVGAYPIGARATITFEEPR